MSIWNLECPSRIPKKNEQFADGYAAEGLKVTANEYYRRAQDFYGNAVWPLPESDPRMLPGYKKMRESFDKAGQMVRPPFERVPKTTTFLPSCPSRPSCLSCPSRHARVLIFSDTLLKTVPR